MGVSHVFLNCTSGTKFPKASQIFKEGLCELFPGIDY